MKGLYCCILFFIGTSFAFGQATGDFQSFSSGVWNSPSTWSRWNGTSWVNPAPNAPTSDDGVVSILNGHSVSITANVTIDQVIVQAGGSLTVDPNIAGSTVNVILNNGSGDDLVLNGPLTLADDGFGEGSNLSVAGKVLVNATGSITVTDPFLSVITFTANAVYEHNRDGGTVPSASWNVDSNCLITGVTMNVPTGLSQSFGNFTWNCLAQSGTRNLGLTSSSTFKGSLHISATNGGILALNQTSAATIVVQKDFQVSGTARFGVVGAVAQTVTLRVNRDFIYTSSGSSTLAGNTGTATIEIKRHFTISAGIITKTTAGQATFVINGSGVQDYTGGSSIPGAVNYTVVTGSTLNLGAYSLSGPGLFTLQSGATIHVKSPDGLNSSVTASGNIQTSARDYASGGNIVYNAAVGQTLGDEWGASGELNGVAVNLEIANTSSSGVTNNIIGGASLVGNLRLTTGSLNIGNSNTLEIRSNFIRVNGTVGGDASSDLIFSGDGDLASLVFTSGQEFINDLTISRSTDLTLGSNLVVTGTINLTGGNLNFSGRSLTMNGSSINTSGTGLRSTSANSVLVIGGSTFTGSIPFSGTGNQLSKLTFRAGGGAYTWNSSVVVHDSVRLTLGALNHSSGLRMANNSVFLKGGGTITGSGLVVNGSDRYNLTYTGEGDTGVELPSTEADALNNLVISSSGTITLTQNVKVNGNLALSGGTFDSNAQGVEIVGNFIANATSDFVGTTVTFSGPSSTISGANVTFDDLTITGTVSVNAGPEWNILGDIVNNGSLTVIAGRASFEGTTTISGSSVCNFNAVRIQGILNAPSQMNVAGQFTFIDGGTFNANSGTVNFTGAPSTLSNVGDINFHNILISGALTSSVNLNLTGNFTDNGSFDRSSGTVRFVGTSTQLIGGTSVTEFNNITITNAAGPPAVQVVSNKNLRGVLTLSAGTIFDPDGPSGSTVFRLRSTGDVFSSGVTNDAAIAALPSGAVVNGNVTIERYMALEGANSNRVYRYISSPISNTPASQLIDNFKISGTFTGSNQAGKQSMFGYTETATTDTDGNGVFNINDGYFDFPANNITETMDNGRGYSIFVYGNESPYTVNGNALWDVRGTINSGEIVFNAFTTLTNSSDPSADGWNLVGNPYPSTIDWDAASGWTKTGIANAIYMRDNGQTSPVYASYVNGAGTNGGSRYIPIGQAFQVRATGLPINFRATEAVKVGGQQATYFREIPQQIIRVALNNGTVQDEMVVRFTDAATDGFDAEWDAYKLPNYRLNLSSITGGNEKFAINSLPGLTCGKTVKLSMTDVPAGTYSLSFSEFESIPMEMGIQLFDSYKSTTINVREEAYYSFDVTEDVNSFGNNRFELRFITKEVPDFNAIADDVCESSQAFVNITNSEQGVRYRIMKNGTSLTDWQLGTGSELSLQLQTAQLAGGENLLSIQASVQECESVFLDKPLEIKVVPLTQVEKVDNGSSCGPGKVVLSAEGTVDGNYKWYETESDNVAISGAVNGVFTTPELNKTKTYYVSTLNDLGCESARKPVVAEIVMVDAISITVDNETNTLTSNYKTGNQWFFNGEQIPGATGQVIEVTETGLYEVQSSVNSCTTRASQEMIVLGSEGGKANGISFYPNPVADILYIELPDARPAKGEITSSAGHPLGSIDFSNGKAEFNFSGHAAGLYLVKVTQGNTVVHYKIIKK